jgi:D-xylose transport system substrate-binding protein
LKKGTAMNKHGIRAFLALVCCCLPAAAFFYFSTAQGQTAAGQVVAGVCFDILRERWARDERALSSEAAKQSVRLLVKSAESNDDMQVAQAKEMINSGAKILLVVPHNLKRAGEIVNYAHSKNIKVIAYDRIIRDCDLDFYVSFDNQKVGELQAEYALEKAPAGNYVLLGGSPADNNAIMVHAGWMKVLGPAAKSGRIKIAYDQYTPDWKRENAQANMAAALGKIGNEVSVVIAGNDTLAGGALQALAAKGLGDGKVVVIGQDAEPEALQRIRSGTQAMTIYKPIPRLASAAIDLAAKTLRGEKINQLFNQTVNNGFKDVPSILLEPVAVDKGNMAKTIGQDGPAGH